MLLYKCRVEDGETSSTIPLASGDVSLSPSPDPGRPNAAERAEIAERARRESDGFVETRLLQSGDDGTWDGYDLETGRPTKRMVIGGRGKSRKELSK